MSGQLTIVSNRVPRDVLRWYELTEKERAEFDYLDTDEKQSDASFMRYKGQCYDLGDFEACPHKDRATPQMRDAGFCTDWHGYAGDSFFSGVLVRYVQDCERVIVGRYYV